MSEQLTTVELGGSTYSLKHMSFDPSVDMDELTRIHYDNLVGEILTIPTLMNKVGILKAEADKEVRSIKLELNILEAKKSESYRETLAKRDGEKVKYPTVAQVDSATTKDEEVVNKTKQLHEKLFQLDVIDSLYWAVKSKEMKLNKISEGITPADFEKELLEGTINSVLIKKEKRIF